MNALDNVRSILSGSRAFVAALILLTLFNAYHFWAVPACFTYDSFEYIRYADLLGTDRFHTEYYFSRPPLYPALLRVSFEVFGRNSFAAILTGLLMGWGGVVLIGLLIRRWKYPVLSLAVMVLLSIAPEFIAYQHTVLTEIGAFFFLTLALFAVAFPQVVSWRAALLTALALGIGYYQRPTVVYLAPVLAVLVFVRWRETNAVRRISHELCGAFLVLILPFVLAYPWTRIVAEKPLFKDMSRLMIGFGILKGVLYPPEDPVLDNYRDAYIKAIADSSRTGRLDASGLTQISFVHFQWGFMGEHSADADRLLLDGARKYPLRYIKGVGRCMLYFMGRDSADDDNMNTVRAVFDPDATQTALKETGHPSFEKEAPNFRRETGRSLLSKVSNRMAVPFRWLLIAGSALSLAGALAGILRRDGRLFAVTLIPLSYLLLHALILMSVNRYAFPGNVLLLANLFLVPALILRPSPTSASANTRTSPTPPAA